MTDPKEVTYEAEVIEDARTGEEIPAGIQKAQLNTLATSLDLTKVGTTVLDDKAEGVLNEPIKPEEVSIRPDGLVYLPWTWYADRLNRAFGRLGWGLVPQSGPMKQDMGNNILVVWGHWLVVRGIPVGFEMGECAYNPSNHTMSYGDAAAGAKSNSLARNCKMLGMSLELWNQEWIENWKKQYAERVKNPKGNRPEYIWQKKKANGHQPQRVVDSATQKEVVETVVGYVSKKVWDEHAQKIADDNNQDKPANGKPEPTYEALHTWQELKGMEAELAQKTGLSKAKVAIALAKLNKAGSYSIQEVTKTLKGE